MASPIERLLGGTKLSADRFNSLLYKVIRNRLLEPDATFEHDGYYIRLPSDDNPELLLRDYSTVFSDIATLPIASQAVHTAALEVSEAILDVEPATGNPVVLAKPSTINPATFLGAAVIRRGVISLESKTPVMLSGAGDLVTQPQSHPSAQLAIRLISANPPSS
jgi:hypothetical protein